MLLSIIIRETTRILQTRRSKEDMEISNRAKNIAPSLTLAITAKAKAMKAQGLDVVSFGAGEPDFNTPSYIIDAAKDALDRGMTKYTPVSGTPELRAAICDKFLRDNGLSYTPDQIVVSTGGKQTLRNAFEAVINPGDEVILPAPYWLTYPELIRMSGGEVVYLDTDASSDFKVTPEALEKAITPKTKAFVLNNPSNPNGSVYTEAELRSLAAVLEDKDVYIISDEIYEKLVYGVEFFSVAAVSEKIKEKTIICSGLSKTYAMTGWRMGYSAAPLAVAKAMSSIQSHTTSNANSIAQYASYIALTDKRGDEFLTSMQKTFDERRKLISSLAKKIPYAESNEPKGAFYIMINVSGAFGKKCGGTEIKNSSDFCAKLLETELVAAVDGAAFGAPEYIRLSYAISESDIVKGMERITNFMKALN